MFHTYFRFKVIQQGSVLRSASRGKPNNVGIVTNFRRLKVANVF